MHDFALMFPPAHWSLPRSTSIIEVDEGDGVAAGVPHATPLVASVDVSVLIIGGGEE